MRVLKFSEEEKDYIRQDCEMFRRKPAVTDKMRQARKEIRDELFTNEPLPTEDDISAIRRELDSNVTP